MRLFIIFTTVFLLVACTIPSMPRAENKKESPLFLKGEFTYWQALPEFAFKTNEEKGIKFLITDIKYDGNPYQIVIADRAWSADKNCGYTKPKLRTVVLNNWLELDCDYDNENDAVTPIQKPLEFDLKYSGRYLFELKLNEQGNPTHLRVSSLKSKSKTKKAKY